MRKFTKSNFSQATQGFTIVELMVALSILSTILVMSTVILIQIGALYSKGVNSANLQNATRGVVADVSASLQYTADSLVIGIPNTTYFPATAVTPAASVNVYCIGTTRYSYVLGRELGTDQGTSPSTMTQHVLWRDTMKDPSDPCTPLPLNTASPTDSSSTGGYEMLGDHMRLTNFIITSTASRVYSVSVNTAFGDSDLLNSSQTNCRGVTGDQFCATSQITTVVTQRVQ